MPSINIRPSGKISREENLRCCLEKIPEEEMENFKVQALILCELWAFLLILLSLIAVPVLGGKSSRRVVLFKTKR